MGTPCTVVVTAALSGEVLLVVADASSRLTVFDVLQRLKAQVPLPGKLRHYKLSCGPSPLVGNCSLENCMASNGTQPCRIELTSVIVAPGRPDVKELLSMPELRVQLIRSMPVPPRCVVDTFKALMLLLGLLEEPDMPLSAFWSATRTHLLLSKEHLITTISNFDLDECDASAALGRTRPFLDDINFVPESMSVGGLACSVCGIICWWIRTAARFLERRIEDKRLEDEGLEEAHVSLPRERPFSSESVF